VEQYQDRFDAGRRLVGALRHLQDCSPVVVGLARGGVEVASVVARALGAPLDVLIARKVGAPQHPEYGIGAVAPGGISVYDRAAVTRLGISDEELEQITGREVDEVERRLELYRGNKPLELGGRCVIVIDDGLATGITALAACRYARSLQPKRLVFAVPVSSEQGADLIRPEVDEFIALQIPPLFYAVGAWYEDFSQTSDEQVLKLLQGDQIGRSNE
jgi:predicted phosphoribosyltransferase